MTTKTEKVLHDLVAEHGPVPYELPDVSTPEGNGFHMIASFREVARLVSWPEDAIGLVTTLAMSADYDQLRHVLQTVCWEDE